MEPSRHAQDRNFLESIVRQIPGFKGYLEEEYRRESDHLARTHICDQLQMAKQGIDRYLRQLADRVQLDALPAVERVRARVEAFANRVRSAERGYSGLFDFVRTGEAELEQMYQLDMSLVGGAQEFATHCGDLAAKGEPSPSVADDLEHRLGELEARFRQRGEILQGLGK